MKVEGVIQHHSKTPSILSVRRFDAIDAHITVDLSDFILMKMHHFNYGIYFFIL